MPPLAVRQQRHMNLPSLIEHIVRMVVSDRTLACVVGIQYTIAGVDAAFE